MEDANSGLRVRLRRSLKQTRSQHEKLGEISRELDRALESHDPMQAGLWIERLAHALEAHFELEQSVLFPILLELKPATHRTISQLTVQHGVFLEGLGRVDAVSAAHDAGLSKIRSQLRAHEATEEELLDEVLTRET